MNTQTIGAITRPQKRTATEYELATHLIWGQHKDLPKLGLTDDEFNEWARQFVNNVNGKSLICNGSINQTLTLPELLQFPKPYLLQALHWLNVELSSNSTHNLNYDTYIIQDFQNPVSPFRHEHYEAIYYNSLPESITTLWEMIQDKNNSIIEAAKQEWNHRGYMFAKDLTKYGVGGFFQFRNLEHITGFIQASGSWNDFKVDKVIESLNLIEQTFPRLDYGDNNPNTGIKIHKWKTKPGCEYITACVEYCTQLERDKMIEWFKSNNRTVKQINNCDSIRYETNDHEYNGADFQLVMWWD